MKKKFFYLHVCYSKTQDGITYKNDALVKMSSNDNIEWLRNALKEAFEKLFGIKFREPPIIDSMTELSKELYETLNQKKEE